MGASGSARATALEPQGLVVVRGAHCPLFTQQVQKGTDVMIPASSSPRAVADAACGAPQQQRSTELTRPPLLVWPEPG